MPEHVEALVDVAQPGQRMPWIHSLNVDARERKEEEERSGDRSLQLAYQRRVTEEAAAKRAEAYEFEAAQEAADAKAAEVAERRCDF